MKGVLEGMKESRDKFEYLKFLVGQKQSELQDIHNQMKMIQGEYMAFKKLADDNNLIDESINEFNQNQEFDGPTSADENKGE